MNSWLGQVGFPDPVPVPGMLVRPYPSHAIALQVNLDSPGNAGERPAPCPDRMNSGYW